MDVTDPMSPSVLGFLKTETSGSIWRDIKVRADLLQARYTWMRFLCGRLLNSVHNGVYTELYCSAEL